MTKKLLVLSFATALAEGIYVSLVAWLMINGNQIFGKMPSVFGFVSFLLLFVVSAAISGALILGKPILLYLENKRKDAVILFFLTLAWLVLFLLILLGTLMV